MTHPLRSEDKDAISFITNRTIGSRLWFINNKSLEDSILSYLAKYQKIYQVKLYALILMGNHYHLIAQFPNCNKSAFMQSFNSIIAKLVPEHVASFDQGKLKDAVRERLEAGKGFVPKEKLLAQKPGG